MSEDIRSDIIGKSLGIKPINHGKVHTFQIALPEARKQTIPLERRQAIERSFLTHQSNLVSLIIRRTDAYEDEDIDYELVYGADWLQVAQELDIEKVWAWVFDMTDEQVEAAIAEMDSLSGGQPTTPTPAIVSDASVGTDLETLIEQKLQLATESIKNSVTSLLGGLRTELDEKLKSLNYRFDRLSSTSPESSDPPLQAVLDKLNTIEQQLVSPRKKPSSTREPLLNKINLLEASEQDLETALKQVGATPTQVRAAIAAVKFWKQSEQGLTWENLEFSATKAKKRSPQKIDGFAKGTLDRLRDAADIPENE